MESGVCMTAMYLREAAEGVSTRRAQGRGGEGRREAR